MILEDHEGHLLEGPMVLLQTLRDLDQYTVFLKFLSPPPKDSKVQEKLGFPGHSEPEQRQSKKEENSLSPLWNKNNGRGMVPMLAVSQGNSTTSPQTY